MTPVVVVDCFASSLSRYRDGWAVVGIDVIRATTTAVTAASTGRRVFPVRDLDQAAALAQVLPDPVLAGEQGGDRPAEFEENNSPAAFARRRDVHRPLVLLSTSGTQLIHQVGPRDAVYATCLRNASAQVEHLVGRHERVAVIGAGTRGAFRDEDQLCCAWVAAELVRAGYKPLQWTTGVIERWRDADLGSIAVGPSADYLRRSGQLRDLDFILSHVDDVDDVFAVDDGQLVCAS
jgi:2-phosphosulfolactate phosphatase